jgi:hypothetical protein
MTPSARRIRAVIVHVVSAATLDRLIDPILSDIDIEKVESARNGRRWRARWIVLSGYVGLFRALTLHGLHELAGGAGFDDEGGRAVRRSAAAFVVVTTAMMLPPLLVTPDALKADLGMLAVTLVPQAVPVSLPVAVAFGIAVTWPKRPIRRVLLRRALVLGLAGMVLTLATMEWFVPAGNRTFRTTVFRALAVEGIPPESIHLPRGIGERSLSELAVLAWRTRTAVGIHQHDAELDEIAAAQGTFGLEQLALAVQVRLILSCATGLLCLLAAAIASTVPGRAIGRLAFGGVTALYLLSFVALGDMAHIVSPTVVVWVSTIGLAVAPVLLLRVRRLAPSD